MPLTGDYAPSPSDFARTQVEEYESSGGTRANTLLDTGLPVVILSYRGAQSGKVRKTPVMRVEDGGRYALVASKMGAPVNPGWYACLKAEPLVMIQDGAEPHDFVVREVTDDEREKWWARSVAAFPGYAGYAEKTDRLIPVFVAEPA
jgi:deazaflavin-dependent oxidoreductase (nitroreductase family)